MDVEKELRQIADYEEWLFDQEVHLIDHFPDYFKENREVVAFCEAADPELNLFRRRARMALDNSSILTCDERGIRSFEEMVGITPDPYQPLETRRTNVIARMHESLPYTEIRLIKMLAAIAGWGHFTYIRDGAFVNVTLDATASNALGAVRELLERVLPMNLYYGVSLGLTRSTGVRVGSFIHFGQELTIKPYGESEVTTEVQRIYTSAHMSMEINKWQ